MQSRKLYETLRDRILAGELKPGARLPGTRALAAELGVSRNTTLAAYEQLVAEGYVIGRAGAGAFVAQFFEPARKAAGRPVEERARLSRRGAVLAATPVSRVRRPGQNALRPFTPGSPPLDLAPIEELARLQLRAARRLDRHHFGYGDAAGYAPLREALANHLALARGVKTEAEHILIIAGSQEGLDLTARVLLDPGDTVAVENPGYLGARGAFLAAGANLAPIPVDASGLLVSELERSVRRRSVRLVYSTPSRQFPSGVTLSLERRLALLKLAEERDFYILEDEYDSDYRYSGRPIAALQGLDTRGRVLYLGTLSKAVFPGMRLGFLALPANLAESFQRARALIDRHSPILSQAAVAEFFASGAYFRHVRRMREVYRERRDALLDALESRLGDAVAPYASDSGMFLSLRLPRGASDQVVSRRAAELDVDAPALSEYRLGPERANRDWIQSGLMLGFAAYTPREIQSGVARLARAFDK